MGARTRFFFRAAWPVDHADKINDLVDLSTDGAGVHGDQEIPWPPASSVDRSRRSRDRTADSFLRHTPLPPPLRPWRPTRSRDILSRLGRQEDTSIPPPQSPASSVDHNPQLRPLTRSRSRSTPPRCIFCRCNSSPMRLCCCRRVCSSDGRIMQLSTGFSWKICSRSFVRYECPGVLRTKRVPLSSKADWAGRAGAYDRFLRRARPRLAREEEVRNPPAPRGAVRKAGTNRQPPPLQEASRSAWGTTATEPRTGCRSRR